MRTKSPCVRIWTRLSALIDEISERVQAGDDRVHAGTGTVAW